MSRRLLLILAVAAFVGWLSYLGYAVLTKYRGPVISRAQAAAAKSAIRAKVDVESDLPKRKVTVIETLSPNGPARGSQIEIENLPAATEKSGFTGEGEYLLLLTDPPYSVVGQQRSPGNNVDAVRAPLVYRWSEELRMEFEKLPKASEPNQ
jgi:hypothetical protein